MSNFEILIDHFIIIQPSPAWRVPTSMFDLSILLSNVLGSNTLNFLDAMTSAKEIFLIF